MPRRKAPAPVQGLGRVEDRHLALSAGGSGEDAAVAEGDEWQLTRPPANSSDEEEAEALRQRPKKRRRKAAGSSGQAAERVVAVALLQAAELEWPFGSLAVAADVPLGSTHAAGADAGPSTSEAGQDGPHLELVLPQGSDILTVRCSGRGSSGDGWAAATWQGCIVAPTKEAADALLALLKSGHLCCALMTSPPGDGGDAGVPSLLLGLSAKATGEAAEHPEEQQQRQWHRQLLQLLLGWLAPHLDPERELDLRAAQAHAKVGGAANAGSSAAAAAAAASSELLNSPLCSPRAGGSQPGSPPFSPGRGGGGAAAAPAFDAAELYAAVKPTGAEPELPAGTTDATLLPTLRHYQARAAQWMVNREKGVAAGCAAGQRAAGGTANGAVKEECDGAVAGGHARLAAGAAAVGGGAAAGDDDEAGEEQQQEQGQAEDAYGEDPSRPLHPLWRKVPCIEVSQPGGDGGAQHDDARGSVDHNAGTRRCFFVNAYGGQVALRRFPAAPEVRGGILSDEMGLGKTVELLACITAHRYAGPPPTFDDGKKRRKRTKRERIDCLCEATSEEGYSGLWLQCDECNAWMHAACLGLRRAPPGEFVCGPCQRDKAAAAVRQDCGATLVVCPTPILHQWRDEILRHIRPGALKLRVYEGQAQAGAAGGSKVVTAADLASADIVLTTYDVLRHDVHHAPDAEEDAGAVGRKLRHKKKYEIVPTPLTRLRWWRVCLDEAQMVESSTARAAQMALKLQTVHRWCVTGTPLSRGLEDLYGLLAFLQAEPYSNHHWWLRAVQRPYEEGSRAARARLLALLKPSLGGLLWRSAKADVAHEIGLPPQHHHLTKLQMSAIERHFLNRQHQDCVEKARAALSASTLAAATAAAAALDGVEVVGEQADAPAGGACRQAAAAAAASFEDRALTRREEASLLHPLLRLRQACCHPQVGGAGIKAVAHQRAPMTMGEVLEVMLAKARVEAEDVQRLLLSALNGLAGLLLLQGMPAEAVKAYREALALIDQNKALVRADKLQQLHTMHNLADLLGADGKGVPGVAPTLRDGQLAAQAQELRDEYLAESAARLAAAGGEVEDAQQHAAKAKAPLLQQVAASQAEASVARRIKDQLKEETMYLRSVSQNATTIAGKFRDLAGLELAVKQELRELGRAQAEALGELNRLQNACQQPTPALVELAATCSRCRAETAVAGRVCRHCKLEELFWGWEGRAFALYSKAREGAANVTAEDAIRQAQQAVLQGRVGRGGLGEAAVGGVDGEEEGGHDLMLGAGRGNAVAKTEIVRRPGDAENTLRLLLHQLRLLRVPPEVAAEKELVLLAGRVHLELMELHRRLYLKARALSLAQRARLYALDELEQCTMRIKLLSDDELRLKEGEEIYRIYEHEVPIRSTELSNDKAAAELELRRKLGTLRYLMGIKAREAARAAAAAEAAAAQEAMAAVVDVEEGDAAAEGRAAGVRDPQAQAAVADASQRGPSAHGTSASDGEALQQHGPAPSAGTPRRRLRAAAGLAGRGVGAGEAAAGGEEDREDICPICHDRLGLELVMLPCAHRLCCRCCMALQDRLPAGLPQPNRRIECPVCRTRVPVAELVYVDARLASSSGKDTQQAQRSGASEDDIQVSGSYGTKLEAVVRRLLWLTRADATARVLVFSTWKDLLELLSHALTANKLPHLYPRSAKKFEAAVAEFRTGHAAAVAAERQPGSSKVAAIGGGTSQPGGKHPQVLLLLMKQGANGLNLTEAQHVVLCEPLLDPAVEAQAVGRVHRIGQRRATHVHRFVVDRTIEENVHRLCQQRAAAMDLSAASVKRAAGSKERGALTVRDVALLLRRPEEEEAAEMEVDVEGEAGPGTAGTAAQLSPRAAAAAAAAARAAAAAAAASAEGGGS